MVREELAPGYYIVMSSKPSHLVGGGCTRRVGVVEKRESSDRTRPDIELFELAPGEKIKLIPFSQRSIGRNAWLEQERERSDFAKRFADKS